MAEVINTTALNLIISSGLSFGKTSINSGKKLVFLMLFMIGSLWSFADPPDWSVNPADFEFNMNGTIRVKTANNIFLNEANTMIGVFVGGETRGVVNADDIIFIGDEAYFPVTMYSNEQSYYWITNLEIYFFLPAITLTKYIPLVSFVLR